MSIDQRDATNAKGLKALRGKELLTRGEIMSAMRWSSISFREAMKTVAKKEGRVRLYSAAQSESSHSTASPGQPDLHDHHPTKGRLDPPQRAGWTRLKGQAGPASWSTNTWASRTIA
jgi:hypothetical protein